MPSYDRIPLLLRVRGSSLHHRHSRRPRRVGAKTCWVIDFPCRCFPLETAARCSRGRSRNYRDFRDEVDQGRHRRMGRHGCARATGPDGPSCAVALETMIADPDLRSLVGDLERYCCRGAKLDRWSRQPRRLVRSSLRLHGSFGDSKLLFHMTMPERKKPRWDVSTEASRLGRSRQTQGSV